MVLPGKATCDMVLLQGNCLVEESVLSGEVLAHLKPGHAVVFGCIATACSGCAACLLYLSDQQPTWKHWPFCLKSSAFCNIAWQMLSILPPCTFSVYQVSAMCWQMHNINSVHPTESSTLSSGSVSGCRQHKCASPAL